MSPTMYSAPGEAFVWRYGRLLLTAALVLGILVTLAAAALAPDLVIFLPIVLLAGVAAWHLFRRPNLNLAFILAWFPLVADFDEGLDVDEMLFGMYYVAFLGHWYFRAVVLERRRLIDSRIDRLLVFVVAMVLAYVPISFAYGGDLIAIRGELMAFTMLGFYFPIKDLVARSDKGVRIVFLMLLWTGLFVTVRNIYLLQELLSQATMAWQVTQKGRVATNEILILTPAYAVLAWSLQVSRLSRKLTGYAVFLVLMFGLVMTQSRGYWVSFTVGALLLFLLLDRKGRAEVVTAALACLAVSVALVFIVFGQSALLLVAGLFNRMLSLGSATTRDISLINRFLESKAVFGHVLKNPILGHGMGVAYSYFDPTIAGTRTRPFIHNGYLSLWYRFGIVGLISICWFWFSTIRVAIRESTRAHTGWGRAAAMVSAAGLSSLVLSAMTSTPFHHNDLLLMIALMTGMASGIAHRRDSLTGVLPQEPAPER